MHLFASDIEVINSIKEEYPGYNELLLLSAIILNIDGSESKILNNSIFPVGRISPCKNKRLVLKIDEIESYLDLIFSHIFIKKEECLFSIILSEEQRKDIDDIINYMKIIQNLFLNEDTENKYIKKKILNILEFYIQMLLNINYIRSLNDLKDYAKGIINIKNFILDKCLFESLKNHLNIYSFIASLRFFIEETKQSESKEKKLILKDKFYYYFYNHICLSFNNIHAPYVIKLKKNIIDTRAVPVKLNCFSESFCHDDFYTFESLEKFDNEVNKKYQKNSNMKIYFDKKSFQNIKNFNCWGLAVSVAFLANYEKSK